MLDFAVDTVLFPAVPAAVIALIAAAMAGVGRRASIATGLAIAAGFVVGSWRLDGAPVYPPAAAQHWLPFLAAGGVLAGTLLLLVPTRSEEPPFAAPFYHGLPVVVAASGASGVAFFSYTAKLSQLAAVIAASTGACLAVHLLVRRGVVFGPPALLAALAPLGWLVIVTKRYNEMPAAALPPLLAAVVAPLVPIPHGLDRPVRWTLVRTAVTAALAGGAVLVARAAYEPFDLY